MNLPNGFDDFLEEVRKGIAEDPPAYGYRVDPQTVWSGLEVTLFVYEGPYDVLAYRGDIGADDSPETVAARGAALARDANYDRELRRAVEAAERFGAGGAGGGPAGTE